MIKGGAVLQGGSSPRQRAGRAGQTVLHVLSIVVLLAGCSKRASPPSEPKPVPTSTPPAGIQAYLDMAKDVARGLGASDAVLSGLAGFLDASGPVHTSNPQSKTQAMEIAELQATFFELLRKDHLLYIHDSEEFADNIALNFPVYLERWGYHWSPAELPLQSPVRISLLDRDGNRLGVEVLGKPQGLAEADANEVITSLARLIGHGGVSFRPVSVVSQDFWFLIVPDKNYDALARRYGPQIERILSMTHPWSGVSPVIPPEHH